MGTTKENGPVEIKDVNDLGLVYSTKDDYDLVQAMGEVYSKIAAIEEEIHEEYFGADNNPDEDALICHLELLEEEYIALEIQHKAKSLLTIFHGHFVSLHNFYLCNYFLKTFIMLSPFASRNMQYVLNNIYSKQHICSILLSHNKR